MSEPIIISYGVSNSVINVIAEPGNRFDWDDLCPCGCGRTLDEISEGADVEIIRFKKPLRVAFRFKLPKKPAAS